MVRKGFFMYLAGLFALGGFAASCSESLPDKIESFVCDVENNYQTYSENDWTSADERFDALCAKYEEKRPYLSPQEKRQVNDAVGRYVNISLPVKIESFLMDVEQNYQTYSEMDWADAEETIQIFYEEYNDNVNAFSTAEKKRINQLFVRYKKLWLYAQLNYFISNVKENFQSLSLDDGDEIVATFVNLYDEYKKLEKVIGDSEIGELLGKAKSLLLILGIMG